MIWLKTLSFFAATTGIRAMKSEINLANIRLTPVVNGATSGECIEAGSLWNSQPAMVYVIRRPG
jgi:hypothetical protein